jgi:hypothetical protein
MPSVQLGISLNAGSVSIQETITRTPDAAFGYEVTLPVAKTGTLSTRTDDETGTLTMSASHGITTGAIIDIYWSGGARYGVLVGTVSVNSVPIGADDAGTGDVLPAADTAITAAVQVQSNVYIDGDNLSMIGVELNTTEGTSGVGHCDFQETDNTSIVNLELVGNTPKVYDIAGGATNPFTGDPIFELKASNGSSSTAATLKVCGGYDSTP